MITSRKSFLPSRGSSIVDKNLYAVGSAVAVVADEYMEDRIVMSPIDIGDGRKKALLAAAIDGHGGLLACSFIAAQLIPVVGGALRRLFHTSSVEPSNEDWQRMLSTSFEELDTRLRSIIEVRTTSTRQHAGNSGACISLVIVTHSQIVCANLGDCNASIRSSRDFISLTTTHDINNASERARLDAIIRRTGGKYGYDPRMGKVRETFVRTRVARLETLCSNRKA